jgi:hypothetical protein
MRPTPLETQLTQAVARHSADARILLANRSTTAVDPSQPCIDDPAVVGYAAAGDPKGARVLRGIGRARREAVATQAKQRRLLLAKTSRLATDVR